MNKREESKEKRTILSFFKAYKKETVLLLILAIALLFSIWKIYFDKEGVSGVNSVSTETEKRVAQLLQEMEGVGSAEVIVCENENGVQSVVVVCEGAKNLQVVMDVREAVAAALGTQESCVKIYLKKIKE